MLLILKQLYKMDKDNTIHTHKVPLEWRALFKLFIICIFWNLIYKMVWIISFVPHLIFLLRLWFWLFLAITKNQKVILFLSGAIVGGHCLLTCLLVVVILFSIFFSEYCGNTRIWGLWQGRGWWCPCGKGGLMHCALVFEVVNPKF